MFFNDARKKKLSIPKEIVSSPFNKNMNNNQVNNPRSYSSPRDGNDEKEFLLQNSMRNDMKKGSSATNTKNNFQSNSNDNETSNMSSLGALSTSSQSLPSTSMCGAENESFSQPTSPTKQMYLRNYANSSVTQLNKQRRNSIDSRLIATDDSKSNKIINSNGQLSTKSVENLQAMK